MVLTSVHLSSEHDVMVMTVVLGTTTVLGVIVVGITTESELDEEVELERGNGLDKYSALLVVDSKIGRLSEDNEGLGESLVLLVADIRVGALKGV